MDSPLSQSGPSDYLETLKRAGEQAIKEFDNALVAAMGVEGKAVKSENISPFAAATSLQQQYWSPVIDFWRGFLGGTSARAESGKPQRGDRRFKDEAWHRAPYYDLFKQSYLATSKQLSEFVDQAEVG
jgi:polyhydroxyalkanoate synthase subunit PhaC